MPPGRVAPDSLGRALSYRARMSSAPSSLASRLGGPQDITAEVRQGSTETGSKLARRHWAIALGLFLSTLAFRVVLAEFKDDHFFHLSKARQVLWGELPVRDFHDDGRVLQILVSAAAQALGGYHVAFHGNMLMSHEDQLVALEKLRGQQVPIAVADLRSYHTFFPTQMTLLHEHFASGYDSVEHQFGSPGEGYRVFLSREVPRTGLHPRWGLPCFA